MLYTFLSICARVFTRFSSALFPWNVGARFITSGLWWVRGSKKKSLRRVAHTVNWNFFSLPQMDPFSCEIKAEITSQCVGGVQKDSFVPEEFRLFYKIQEAFVYNFCVPWLKAEFSIVGREKFSTVCTHFVWLVTQMHFPINGTTRVLFRLALKWIFDVTRLLWL